MATGKTNPRWFRLLVDEVDLSGDSRQIGSFGSEYEMSPVEGWDDGVKYFTFGQPTHIFNGYQAVFNNTATVGSHTELSALEEYYISLCIGIRAAPAVGDPAFLSTMEQINYTIEGTEAVLVNVDTVKAQTGNDQERVWGVVLAPGTSLSATTDGDSVDNGASSANGALAHLHVTGTSAGNWTLKVQDSADDAAWADLITFTGDGSTLWAESGTVAGTVDRYVRFQATRVAGTTTFWVTLARQ
jgi:hypothetical protein